MPQSMHRMLKHKQAFPLLYRSCESNHSTHLRKRSKAVMVFPLGDLLLLKWGQVCIMKYMCMQERYSRQTQDRRQGESNKDTHSHTAYTQIPVDQSQNALPYSSILVFVGGLLLLAHLEALQMSADIQQCMRSVPTRAAEHDPEIAYQTNSCSEDKNLQTRSAY